MSLRRLSGASTSSGVVYDSVSRQPIPGVTLELLAPTGLTGTYYQTDNNGSFVVPTFGTYGLKFTHAEYSPAEYGIQNVAQDMAVYLVPKVKTLPGVTITAGKKSQALIWLAILAVGYYGYKSKWF